MFMDQKTQYCYDSNSLQIEVSISQTPQQKSSKHFEETDRLIPKFPWK